MINCDPNHKYVGRFAPSPTGSLHLGSLVTAVASYCDAMKNNGKWLVRIEDLDPPREIKGASDKIINSLNQLGFEFEKKIIFQSHEYRQLAYAKYLKKLQKTKQVYYCTCTRNQLKKTIHSCRKNSDQPLEKLIGKYSIKIKIPNTKITFIDQIQDEINKTFNPQLDDFIIKRKDGLIAYQLAVVVDDHHQKITHIIRGTDLIDSTPWQIYLNEILGFKQLKYAHIPILTNEFNQKLSKQTFAKEIDNEISLDILLKAYSYLNQETLPKKPKNISTFWQVAIDNWQLNKIAKVRSIQV